MIEPSEPSGGPRAGVVGRDYPESFRSDGVEWLPRRATVKVRISEAEPGVEWYECELELACGQAHYYRYFPFDCFLYVDNELECIVEFKAAEAAAVAYIRCPANREFTLSILSEMAAEQELTRDERELALIFVDLRVVEPAATSPKSRRALQASEDFFSQHRVRIVNELPEPIFVLGAYRSGTSVLTWALGQHPNVWPLEETNFLGLMGSGALAGFANAATSQRNFFNIYDLSQPEFIAHLGENIDSLVRRASERRQLQAGLEIFAGKDGRHGTRDPRFRLMRSAYAPKRRWVDGTPENTGYSLLLRKMFPLAKFVCLVRHPYDAIASLLHFSRAGAADYDVDSALASWKRLTTAVLMTARAFGPDVVKVVVYEDLVGEPLQQLRQVFSFLGEPRFPRASETFEKRINSSSVSAQERREVRDFMEALPDEQSPLPLYETVAALARMKWRVNEAAERALDEDLSDLVKRLRDVLH